MSNGNDKEARITGLEYAGSSEEVLRVSFKDRRTSRDVVFDITPSQARDLKTLCQEFLDQLEPK